MKPMIKIASCFDRAEVAIVRARNLALASGLPEDPTYEVIHALTRQAHEELVAIYKVLAAMKTGSDEAGAEEPDAR